jgi:hypothetical protein
MKLIVAGSTGFVATELIRQALSNPAVKSIAALARRETAVPANARENADPTKLRSVVCDDFSNYPESVKKELENADVCIWYATVTFTIFIKCLRIGQNDAHISLLAPSCMSIVYSLIYRSLGLSQSLHLN